ncbi:hypothetical protein FNV43_RR19958 [Rhamnella rubrinervis]|uniref:Uncharacterized protein n=1 Tax=Rhamnella rubrinervis TaxID=2594499 RepID=A0A8K0E0K6_9ROSA|nr:hypothetical protein FNV43_RR19958 [Rhamnella rubrinervis]
MFPRSETQEEDEEEELAGSDGDEGFDEDMEALRRACMLTGANPDDLVDPTSVRAVSTAPEFEDSDSDEEDHEVLRKIKDRFSIPFKSFQPLTLKPLCSLPPIASDGEEDDLETLRAIKKRFAAYDNDTLKSDNKNSSKKEDHDHSSFKFACPTTHQAGDNIAVQPSASIGSYQSDPCKPSALASNYSSFPNSAKVFMDAIKKNRACQRFLQSKLVHIEAKIAENKKLKYDVKILKDFQVACKSITGRALSQKKDPRVQLISMKKSLASDNTKHPDKRISAIYYGPVENSQVAHYRMALEKLPLALHRKNWSEAEKRSLEKGIRQQFQEMAWRLSYSEGSYGNSNDLDSILVSIKDLDITEEDIRKFLPKVNWEQLASMYVSGRSGAECEARWLNFEDPLINHNPWTAQEDKTLLFLVQEKGISNWFDIALSLGTNRTPFQCLARYQRSLNVSILKREWTKDEDANLRSAVESFGEGNWQEVASVLEGRTGTQCSNRWKKSLHPTRERVGRWSPNEDKCLKVAQMLFGSKNWKKIAQFVPGRTEVQCRERWVNSLDPSLKWGNWTEEEDSNLRAAIAEHGHCWAKVAECMPQRTDNMCRRRWKKLFPHEVLLLQEERRIQKAALICNFVDREWERPAIGPKDFLLSPMITHTEDTNQSAKQTRKRRGGSDSGKKKKLPSCKVPEKRSKKSRKKAQICPEEDMEVNNGEGQEHTMKKKTSDTKMKKNLVKPPSGRKETIEPDESVDGLQLQPESLNLTSFNDWIDTPAGIENTTLAEKRRPRKLQCKRNIDTEKSAEHQNSMKSLSSGSLKDANHQLDHLSCLVSTQSTVINGEDIDTCGGNDNGKKTAPNSCSKRKSCRQLANGCSSGPPVRSRELSIGNGDSDERSSDSMTSRKRSSAHKQQHKKNKGTERTEEMQDVALVYRRRNGPKRPKHGDLSRSDQHLGETDGDGTTLASFVRNKSKKRKHEVADRTNLACFPLNNPKELETFPGFDQPRDGNSVPTVMQHDALTCDSGVQEKFSSCHADSTCLEDNRRVLAAENEPCELNPVEGQNAAFHELVTEQVSNGVEGDLEDGDVTLACFLRQCKSKEEKAPICINGFQACSSSKMVN